MPSAALPLIFASLACLCGDLEPVITPAVSPADSKAGLWIDELEICSGDPVAASQGFDEWTKSPIVNLVLPLPLAERFATLTTQNVGKRLTIRYDGRTISEPVVNEPITAGKVQIFGLTMAEAQQLAADLNSCGATDPGALAPSKAPSEQAG